MTSPRQKRRKYRKWRLKNPDAPSYRIVEDGDYIDRSQTRRIRRLLKRMTGFKWEDLNKIKCSRLPDFIVIPHYNLEEVE